MEVRQRVNTPARADRSERLVAIFGAVVIASTAFWAQAEELTVFKLVARDGAFEPIRLEVPAGKRFKIEISNEGKGPMEFESRDLKQEKVLAAGAKSSVVINGLKPGSYVFFDDYHPDAPKGEIVAK
jgi:Cupredoxin-like domain